MDGLYAIEVSARYFKKYQSHAIYIYICQGKQNNELQKNEIKQNALIAVGGLIARLIVRL